MNREIKFRGWYVKAGKTIMITFGIEGVPKELELKLDYTTVQQFTGLHDKNGNEIFEGDVIKVWTKDKEGYDYNGEVVYVSGSFYFGIGDEFPFNKILGLWNKDSEIIGNIYEHPQLLTP